jgi:enterochelin esterase family protein
VDGRRILDPLNPRTVTFGRKHRQNSEAVMPGYLPPPEIEHDASVAQGATEELPVPSKQDGWSRTVTVYLPHGYAAGARRYPVLYLNDGFGAMNYGKVIPIMDNLIAQKAIPPLIVVLVPSAKNRMIEYKMNPVFEDFFVDELIPAVEARFRTLPGAEHRAIGGISAGATAALSLTLHHADVFGKCIAQSTATELVPLLRLARKGPARPITVYLDVGSFEADFYGRDLVDVSRRLRDTLRSHGCRVRYQEVNEGHGWFNWRARTRDAVRFLFAAGTAGQTAVRAKLP